MSTLPLNLDVARRNNFVILDTETTGLRRPAEVCQIALLDFMGETLMDTLVKTRRPIPYDAFAIHNISDADVANSPTWPEIKEQLMELIADKDVIVYNATYDRHMLHCSDDMWNLPETDYKLRSSWHCAMLWYADLWGEWDEYHGNNRWQKLTTACAQQEIVVKDAHNALGDCKMTFALIRKFVRQQAEFSVIRSELGNPDCEHLIRTQDALGFPVCSDCGHKFGYNE